MIVFLCLSRGKNHPIWPLQPDKWTAGPPQNRKENEWGEGGGDRYMAPPLRPLVGFCDIKGVKGFWGGGGRGG